MAVHDPEAVVHHLEHGHDRVRGAARRGQDRSAGVDLVVVHPVDDVGQAALAGRRQHHVRDAGRLEVLAEPLLVAPLPRVVHEDRVLDPVLRVVDLVGRVRVEHADHVSVGDHRALLLVEHDRAMEIPVDRIVPQQARALLEVVLAAGPDHDRSQAKVVAATGLADHDARDEPPHPAEAVQDDVLGALSQGLLARRHGREHLGHVLVHVDLVAALVEVRDQVAEVDPHRREIELRDGLEHRQALQHGDLGLEDLPREADGLDDLDAVLVDQRVPEDLDDDASLPVEAADDRHHRLRRLLALLPAPQVVVHLRVGHASHFHFAPPMRTGIAGDFAGRLIAERVGPRSKRLSSARVEASNTTPTPTASLGRRRIRAGEGE